MTKTNLEPQRKQKGVCQIPAMPVCEYMYIYVQQCGLCQQV